MAFTVMTWNVENLFRPGDDGGPTSADAYQQKLQNLAGVINQQAPDAISLQEMATCGARKVDLAMLPASIR